MWLGRVCYRTAFCVWDVCVTGQHFVVGMCVLQDSILWLGCMCYRTAFCGWDVCVTGQHFVHSEHVSLNL
jgi:hypothetical protein